jgi:hypothetical protein
MHHIDSDLMEHNLSCHPDKWALDIYDAILCLPGHALQFRHTSASRLKFYNTNRNSIIANFRKSIGATTPKADVMYYNMCKSVVDAGDTPYSPYCMK